MKNKLKALVLVLAMMTPIILTACGSNGSPPAANNNVNTTPEITTPAPTATVATATADTPIEVPEPVPERTIETIQFGGYDWRVLDEQEGRILILADEMIENRYYHSSYVEITWADCDLREYLNGEFYNNFDENEKMRIIQVTNQNLDNQWFGTAGGEATDDYIFLLSLEEIVKYFGDSGLLNNRPNEDTYWINDEYNSLRNIGESWHLRSPGSNSKYAADVDYDGQVDLIGGHEFGGVRPAMWITAE